MSGKSGNANAKPPDRAFRWMCAPLCNSCCGKAHNLGASTSTGEDREDREDRSLLLTFTSRCTDPIFLLVAFCTSVLFASFKVLHRREERSTAVRTSAQFSVIFAIASIDSWIPIMNTDVRRVDVSVAFLSGVIEMRNLDASITVGEMRKRYKYG